MSFVPRRAIRRRAGREQGKKKKKKRAPYQGKHLTEKQAENTFQWTHFTAKMF